MAEQLAAVLKESMDVPMVVYPRRNIYRNDIRKVALSGMQIRSPLFSHSGHNGFSYSSDSGASNSYSSNNSGCSSGSAMSAAAADFGTDELKTIARQMVSDGFTQRMVQTFEHGGDPDNILVSWFLELDVAWVLQIRQENGSQWQLPLQDNSGSSLHGLVEMWIRGFTVIFHSIVELLSTRHEITAVARFGEASILKMLVFVDAIVPAFKAENLRTVLAMYKCVCRAYDNMITRQYCELIFWIEMTALLSRSVGMLCEAIRSTMEKVKTRIEEDDSWAIEVQRGGGEVHRNTRWIADCILSMIEAQRDSDLLANRNGGRFICGIFFAKRSICGLREDAICYLMNLLLRKSELCSDPSLGHLFLLNNYYFATQLIEPYTGHDWKLTAECKEYVCSYLDVSWGHVLSCIPKSNSPGPLLCWINTPSLSSLDKFQSEFNKTYQAQKFWKVPEPGLRNVLRRAITERVVSCYCDYLKEHPELAEHVSRRNSTPEVLKEMLGQLFEG